MKIPWPKRVREALEDEYVMPPLPVQQTLSLPSKEPLVSNLPPNNEDTVRSGENLAVLTKAHEIVQKIEAERNADKAEIGKLQGNLAEVLLLLESEKRKVSLLELDLVTAANNTQALASQMQEMRQFLSLQRQLLDRWEIKTPPKKKRNGKKKAEKPVVEKAPDNG
jgi:hypothetical protein